ncbi:male-specific lethal 3 homolog [Liolophura sinensis]|uniref:male-specific lethal 3 homolog n=1 Tax=Liolophura sinensis TaxID=3198878 RepID=UPI003158A0F8
MATRGVKYQFSVGEHVLCFEPDPTKARVLYEAKVLDLCPGKDRAGRRKAEYHIHFQGWNNSWDRIVGEDFILKSSEENKTLMRRLAETARKYATNYSRKNRVRKQKINAILRRAFVKKPKFDSGSESSSSGSESGSSSGEESEDGEVTEEEESENGRDEYLHNGGDEEMSGVDSDNGDCSDDGEVSIKGKYTHVEIPIPKILKEKLEEDYYNINRAGKVIQLPAEPNIITLLEGYVKNFVMNFLFSSTEKLRPGLREFTKPEPEKSVPLCKEVMHGLRVCFDFTLQLLLLYNAERDQHDSAVTHFKPPSPVNGPPLIKKEVESPSHEAPPSPTVTCPSRRRASTRLHSSSGGEPSPKIPKLSPKVPKDDESESDEPPARRLTRRSMSEVSKKGSEVTCSQRSRYGSQTTRRLSRSDRASVCLEPKVTRSSRRHGSVTSPGPSDKHPDAPDTAPESCNNNTATTTNHTHQESVSQSVLSGLSQRVTPPPPLLLPSAISSKGSSPHLTPTSQTQHNSQTASDKEMALNEVLAWKMLTPEQEKSPLPCLIYGAHHLLRLFVKLPELVGRMKLGEHKQKALLKHFELFLEYLATRHEELLPETVYVNVGEERTGGS